MITKVGITAVAAIRAAFILLHRQPQLAKTALAIDLAPLPVLQPVKAVRLQFRRASKLAIQVKRPPCFHVGSFILSVATEQPNEDLPVIKHQ